jgi:hypothetical protein
LCLVASDRPGADRLPREFSASTLQKRPEFAKRSALTLSAAAFRSRSKKSTASPFSVDEFLREVLVLYEKT